MFLTVEKPSISGNAKENVTYVIIYFIYIKFK